VIGDERKRETPMKCLRRAALIAPFLGALGLAASSPAFAQGKPNILILWGDDIGYWNVSAYNQG
jgi:hypothetical protein